MDRLGLHSLLECMHQYVETIKHYWQRDRQTEGQTDRVTLIPTGEGTDTKDRQLEGQTHRQTDR